jgi:hypothetical protein
MNRLLYTTSELYLGPQDGDELFKQLKIQGSTKKGKKIAPKGKKGKD